MSQSNVLPQAAQSGFAAASAYDAHRPSYPADAVSQLLEALEVSGVQGARILDLAAGTGKFTELLAKRPENYSIIAVEPHDGMRQELEKKNLASVEVYKGTADCMPDLADGSVAALVAAQSFHWFANMDALREIHRVIQPTGVLGMIWNIEDYNAPESWTPSTAWEKTMKGLTWTFEDQSPRFRHEKWREVFDDQNQTSLFSFTTSETLFGLPLGESSIPFETWLSKEDIWKRYRTLSQIAILEGQELKRVEQTFWKAINSPDTETDGQGRVAIHGTTFLAWTSRIPGEPLRSGG